MFLENQSYATYGAYQSVGSSKDQPNPERVPIAKSSRSQHRSSNVVQRLKTNSRESKEILAP
jgi:hypothetical protein